MSHQEKPIAERRFLVDCETGARREFPDAPLNRWYWTYEADGEPADRGVPIWLIQTEPQEFGWKITGEIEEDPNDDNYPVAKKTDARPEWKP